jgi:hypothetical protein
MDDAEVAAKVCALEAELAAASPRIADLEARVSLLEAENARWREAVPIPRGETFRRLEEGLSGSKQEAPQKEVAASFNKVGEGDEKGMAADVINRRSAADVFLGCRRLRSSQCGRQPVGVTTETRLMTPGTVVVAATTAMALWVWRMMML